MRENEFHGIQDLSVKEIFAIFFLWIILFLNFSIFLNKDFLDLFFPNISLIILILTIFLGIFFVAIETWNIIKRYRYHFHNFIYVFYFAIILLIVFKSLLYNKGFSWQFYLIMIVINFNLIIFPRFNIIDEQNYDIEFLDKFGSKAKKI